MKQIKGYEKWLPMLIKALFWVGAAYCIYTGIKWIIWAGEYEKHQWSWLIGGWLYILGGPAILRGYCFALRQILLSHKDPAPKIVEP